jgi:hypothetical protein
MVCLRHVKQTGKPRGLADELSKPAKSTSAGVVEGLNL